MPSSVSAVWVSGAAEAGSALKKSLVKHATVLDEAMLQLHSNSGALYVRWHRSPSHPALHELAAALAVAAKSNVYVLDGYGGSMDGVSLATAFAPSGKVRWTQTEDVGKERAALIAAAKTRQPDFRRADSKTLSSYAGLLRFYAEKEVPRDVRLGTVYDDVLEPTSDGFTDAVPFRSASSDQRKGRAEPALLPLYLSAETATTLAAELFDRATKQAPVLSAASLETKLSFEQAVALTQLLQRTPRISALGQLWEKRFGRPFEPPPSPADPPAFAKTEGTIQVVDLSLPAQPEVTTDSLWEWIQTGGRTRSRHLVLNLVGVRNLNQLAKDKWFETVEFRYCRFGKDEPLPVRPRPLRRLIICGMKAATVEKLLRVVSPETLELIEHAELQFLAQAPRLRALSVKSEVPVSLEHVRSVERLEVSLVEASELKGWLRRNGEQLRHLRVTTTQPVGPDAMGLQACRHLEVLDVTASAKHRKAWLVFATCSAGKPIVIFRPLTTTQQGLG